MSVSDEAEVGVGAGKRVTHEAHGDGVVTSLTTRRLPGRSEPTAYVEVEFGSTAPTWADLVAGREARSGEGLHLMVPAYLLMTGGSSWHGLDDTYEDPYEALGELAEVVGRSGVSYVEVDRDEDVEEFARHLDVRSDGTADEVVSAVRATVDHVVATALAAANRLGTDDRAATLEGYVEKLGDSLWEDSLYPLVPDEVRGTLDTLLVRLAGDLVVPSEGGLTASARRLVDALECRVQLVHGKKIRSAASESRAAKRGA